MQWYQKNSFNKKRLLREIAFIDQINLTKPNTMRYRSEGSSFIVDFVFEYRGIRYVAQCVYPYTYPQVRIIVRIWEPSSKGKFVPYDQGYHNTRGFICYLGHYPNQWDEEYGIEYIYNRVGEWFEEGQHDPNNNLPRNYDSGYQLFVFPEPLSNIENQCFGLFYYSKFQDNANIVTKVEVNGRVVEASFLPTSFVIDPSTSGKGIIIYTTKPMIANPTDEPGQQIKTIMNYHFRYGARGFFDFAGNNEIDIPVPLIIIYLNDNSGQLFFADRNSSSTTLGRFRHFRIYEDIFSRYSDKEQLKNLMNKTVGIIGLGALGSTIAMELARSGITKFVLIDCDKLEIENIGRHDLTLKDINKYKTDAIKEKIVDINPLAQCYSMPWDVLDDLSFSLACLQSCDLIISTIDEEEAKYAINSSLIPNNNKVIFSGVFYNAVAGFISVCEKKMACFKCQSILIDKMAEARDIPDFSSLLPQGIEYGCGRPTFPGGSIKTHSVAILTAEIALNTLLKEREVDPEGYPYNFYLIGNQKMIGNDEFFNGFMDVKRYVLPGIENCNICDQQITLTLDEGVRYDEIMEDLTK